MYFSVIYKQVIHFTGTSSQQ